MPIIQQQLPLIWEEILDRNTGKLTFFYPIGSSSDIPVGMAHLLEHLIANKLAGIVTEISAKTTRDFTEFTIIVDSSQLNTAIHFLFTITEMKWSKHEVEREKKIILRELDQYYLDLNYVYREQLHAAIFAEHSYGLSTTGDRRDIAGFEATTVEYWTSMYPAPAKIEGCGPWRTQDIQNLIHPYIVKISSTAPIHSFNAKVDRMGVGHKFLKINKTSELTTNNAFQGAGWRIKVNTFVSQQSSECWRALPIIWKRRLQRIAQGTSKKFNLRMFMYAHAGVLTLDAATPTFVEFYDAIPDFLNMIKMPITTDEYKYCKTHILLNNLRSRENLLERSALTSQIWIQQFPRIEQLEEAAQAIVHPLNMDDMVSLSTDEDRTVSYTHFPVEIVMNNNKHSFYRKATEIELSTQYLADTTFAPIPSAYWWDERPQYGLKYANVTSVSLTERYHVLYRIKSQCLLKSGDINKGMYRNGTIEKVRYEGNETIVHLAFFKGSDLINSLEFTNSNLRSIVSNLSRTKQNKFDSSYFEYDLKWKVYEAMKHYKLISTKEDDFIQLKGITILQPQMSTNTWLTVDDIVKRVESSDRVYVNESSSIMSVKWDVMKWNSDWTGIAVVFPINSICRHTFILQECAFGLTERVFDSLESWIRKKGFAYRIVQSIISSDYNDYHYFGIQCSMDNFQSIVHLIQTWLEYILEKAPIVEEWAHQRWSENEAIEYYSVEQFLRSTDRLVYYQAIEQTKYSNQKIKQTKTTFELQDYIQNMISTNPKIIRLEPLL